MVNGVSERLRRLRKRSKERVSFARILKEKTNFKLAGLEKLILRFWEIAKDLVEKAKV